MIEQLNQLYEDFKAQLSEVADIQQLDNLKTHFLGKKSPMGNILRGLKDATPEQRNLTHFCHFTHLYRVCHESKKIVFGGCRIL